MYLTDLARSLLRRGAGGRERLLEDLAQFTLSDAYRLRNLWRLCQEVNRTGVAGDFVECGTYKGGSAAVLSVERGPRHLWLYDSFRGMPAVSALDGEDAKAWVSQLVASPSDVRRAMRLAGTPEDSYTIREGFFVETFPLPGPAGVALLHCDADWYESVLQVLERFYPLMPMGACVILDDFGHWEGCREAFYDFCQQHREKPLLERLGQWQAFWFKGKCHNRPGDV